MRKGFTLTELLAVIVFIALISLITIPLVSNEIKKSREDSYIEQVDTVKMAAQVFYGNSNFILKIDEDLKVNLYTLKQEKLIDYNFIDPIEGKNFANDSYVLIRNENGAIVYEFINDGTNFDEYDNSYPVIKGDYVEIIDLGTNFSDYENMIATNYSGNNINYTHNNSGGDIIYTAVDGGNTTNIIKNIITRDISGPTITFTTNLQVRASEVATYDLKSGVTVSDNSVDVNGAANNPITLEYDNTLTAIKGVYSIKYTATDTSGNQTVEYRNVTVIE